MISGLADTLIMVWCLRNRCRLCTLVGHKGLIGVLCAASTSRLLSASKDGSVIEWDLSVGRNVPADKELRELIPCVLFSERQKLKIGPTSSAGNLFNSSRIRDVSFF